MGTDLSMVHNPWAQVLYPQSGLHADNHVLASGVTVVYYVVNVGIWY
jgi:alpha-D-ribose 1-methylphosphonate 5-triphosphate diphosphatase PhnM